MTNQRMFVCGDIHGCVDQLMLKLKELNFNFGADKLYALGDLVDRGPRSADAVALLDQPWFRSIKGNHEVMMDEAFRGNADMHIINGGGWFAQMLDEDERRRLVIKVRKLPIALTIVTPSGRKMGLVHADMVGNDWDEFMAMIDTEQVQEHALWSRERVGNAKHGRHMGPIKNVDHVYFGHTPLNEPIHISNMSWIDTGCFATGRITVEELL
jgi:serine/threonine protein phosphatase 1